MPHQRRRVQLIRPGLQLNLIARFFGVALLALLLQFILFMCMLGRIASDMPGDALATMETATPELIWVFVISAAVLLPLSLSVGVIVTFRIAGPLHRFESFLKAVARGEKPPNCRIRHGDELHDLCKLLNEATAPLRRADSPAATGGAAAALGDAPAATLESTRADADRDANARLDSAA